MTRIGKEVSFYAADNVFALTAGQYEVWKFMLDYFRKNRAGASIRNICDHFGFTINACDGYLNILVRKGAVEIIGAGQGVKRQHRSAIPKTHDGSCLLCGKKHAGS